MQQGQSLSDVSIIGTQTFRPARADPRHGHRHQCHGAPVARADAGNAPSSSSRAATARLTVRAAAPHQARPRSDGSPHRLPACPTPGVPVAPTTLNSAGHDRHHERCADHNSLRADQFGRAGPVGRRDLRLRRDSKRLPLRRSRAARTCTVSVAFTPTTTSRRTEPLTVTAAGPRIHKPQQDSCRRRRRQSHAVRLTPSRVVGPAGISFDRAAQTVTSHRCQGGAGGKPVPRSRQAPGSPRTDDYGFVDRGRRVLHVVRRLQANSGESASANLTVTRQAPPTRR